MRASAHFKYDPNATYIILTPPSTIGTGQPVYCGYHTQTTSIDGYGNPYRIQYAFIPFLNMDWPGPRHGRLRHAQRQRDEQRVRQRHLRRLQHRRSVTSTPRRSPIRTTSSRSRTAGTTRKAARTATSALGSTTQNITLGGPPVRGAADCGATRRSTRARTAAPSRASATLASGWGTPTAWGFLAVRKFLGTVHASLRVRGQPVHMTKAKTRIALVGVGVLALAGGSTALASKSKGSAPRKERSPRTAAGTARREATSSTPRPRISARRRRASSPSSRPARRSPRWRRRRAARRRRG